MHAETDKRYQIVIWGATGLVGQVLCKQIAKHYQGRIRWAMAARNEEKLKKLRSQLAQEFDGIGDTPLLTADVKDKEALKSVAAQTQVLLCTTGPFAEMGTPVVEACLAAGTHYCDITGEVPWVMRNIKAYHSEAVKKNVKIVHFCGFDSIPSDLGTAIMVDHMQSKLNRRCHKVTHFFVDGKGGFAKGTIMSLFGSYFAEKSVERKQSADPYALDPPSSRRGPDQAEGLGIHYNKQRQKYTVPFMMAPVNTRVVRRSNALLHHSYGSDFSFEEVQEVPNVVVALIILAVYIVTVLLFMLKPLHPIFRCVLPYVGADPVKLAEAPKGHWKSVMIGETEEASGKAPQLVTMHLMGEGDPGYWETSRFLLEAGLCLALQADVAAAEFDCKADLYAGQRAEGFFVQTRRYSDTGQRNGHDPG